MSPDGVRLIQLGDAACAFERSPHNPHRRLAMGLDHTAPVPAASADARVPEEVRRRPWRQEPLRSCIATPLYEVSHTGTPKTHTARCTKRVSTTSIRPVWQTGHTSARGSAAATAPASPVMGATTDDCSGWRQRVRCSCRRRWARTPSCRRCWNPRGKTWRSYVASHIATESAGYIRPHPGAWSAGDAHGRHPASDT